MDTLTKRQKIHDYVNIADEKEVEFIYSIIEEGESGHYEWWNDKNLVAELERRYADLKSGKDKGMDLEEATTHLLSRFK